MTKNKIKTAEVNFAVNKSKTKKPKMLIQFEGATFWNPKTRDNVILTGDKIKWFEDNFGNVEGYTHFFE